MGAAQGTRGARLPRARTDLQGTLQAVRGGSRVRREGERERLSPGPSAPRAAPAERRAAPTLSASAGGDPGTTATGCGSRGPRRPIGARLGVESARGAAVRQLAAERASGRAGERASGRAGTEDPQWSARSSGFAPPSGPAGRAP